MLYASLVLSAVVLVAALTTRRGAAVVATAAVAAPFLCQAILWPPLLQAVLTVVAVEAGWGRRGVLAAFVVAWVVCLTAAVHSEWRLDRLREAYPTVTLAERLPPRPPGPSSVFDESELDAVESERDGCGDLRRIKLEYLHARKVEAFVNGPGFGVARILRDPHRLADPADEPPVPQPGGDDTPSDRTPPRQTAGGLHRATLLDFPGRDRSGPVADGVVLGFRPHRVGKVPEPSDGWAVARLELVGLLLAPEPRVYVSESLPRMDAVGSLPTRHPDGFESPALGRLRAGEELVHEGRRLLGAVRATKTCVECHGGHRGDLLGAFSYRLRPLGS